MDLMRVESNWSPSSPLKELVSINQEQYVPLFIIKSDIIDSHHVDPGVTVQHVIIQLPSPYHLPHVRPAHVT